jgi:hypothetical protein
MAKALLDSDEHVTLLFETIFDELMVDDLPPSPAAVGDMTYVQGSGRNLD